LFLFLLYFLFLLLFYLLLCFLFVCYVVTKLFTSWRNIVRLLVNLSLFFCSKLSCTSSINLLNVFPSRSLRYGGWLFSMLFFNSWKYCAPKTKPPMNSMLKTRKHENTPREHDTRHSPSNELKSSQALA
jgi:hypothetical protein